MLRTFGTWFTSGLLALCLATVFCDSLAASPLEDIKQDFMPTEGFVILAKDDLYLVDMDASDGLMAGDLLVVKGKSEQVVHPKTGEVIEVRGPGREVLQVTMVDDGFSRTALVTPGGKVAAGEPVVRYQGLKAYLQALPGTGGDAFALLTAALPHLLWQGYQSVPSQKTVPADIDLIFRVDAETLTVVAAGDQTLRSYSWPPAAGEVQQASQRDRVTTRMAGETPARTAPLVQEGEPLYLGEVAGAVVMSAFVRHRGAVWVAATDGRTIQVLKVGREVTPVIEVDLPVMEKALTLAWWQPDSGEATYLVAGTATQRKVPNSASTETSISSSVFRFEDGALSKRDTIHGMFLNSFDGDQDNRPEILLAQEFDPENASPPVVRMELRDDRLMQIALNWKLPDDFRIHGSAFADLDGDSQPEITQVENGHLTIYKENRQLFRFPRKFGGSLARLTYDRISGSTDPLHETRFFQIPPQAYQVERNGKVDLVTVGAEIPTLRVPGFGPGVSKTWLTLVEHDGRRFLKKDLAPQFDHPIQGLWVDGHKAFILVTNPGNIFGRDGQSEIFVLSLGPPV